MTMATLQQGCEAIETREDGRCCERIAVEERTVVDNVRSGLLRRKIRVLTACDRWGYLGLDGEAGTLVVTHSMPV